MQPLSRLPALLLVALIGSSAETGAAENEPCTIEPMRIEGGSMSPRITPGSVIEVLKGGSECWGDLTHGDAIVFHSASSHIPLIKAIRGLPGETLAVKDGGVFIGGKLVKNSAGQPYDLPPARAGMIALYAHDYHAIPPGTFLVMGENRHGSTDSSLFGVIESQDILGKLVAEPTASRN